MKTKWLDYARLNANYQMGLEAFGFWLQEIAAVQEDLLLSGSPNVDKAKWVNNSTFSTFASNNASLKAAQDCPLEDDKHPLLKCEKFLKMNCQERYEKAKELKLCFCCLAGKHIVKDCTYKPCGVRGCIKRHHRLLHRDTSGQFEENRSEDSQQREEASSAFCSLKSSEILPVIPVTINIGNKRLSTLALCDSGASLSFIDKTFGAKLNASGEEIDLSIAGIHGTKDVKCEIFIVGIRSKATGTKHHLTVYTHPKIHGGSKVYNHHGKLAVRPGKAMASRRSARSASLVTIRPPAGPARDL